jgi:hypothetical protein
MTTKNIIELTIQDLQKRWKRIFILGDINKIRITEHFKRHCERTYTVNSLAMDLDNEWVCCYDNQDILLKEFSVLSLFLNYQISKIEVEPSVEERLYFGTDGFVIISFAK